jgi:hypothetical protein
MSKIKLGNTPKTFKPCAVKFPMPDGSEGVIQATFHYRTRTQFGQFLNQVFADAGDTPKADEKPDFEVIFAKTKDKNADHLTLALAGWDVEDQELNRQNLQQLADELPGAAVALMTAYNLACTEGRLGN